LGLATTRTPYYPGPLDIFSPGTPANDAFCKSVFHAIKMLNSSNEDDTQQCDNECEKPSFPDDIFNTKAPKQTTPGTKTQEGQHINDKGRVEPWKAHYDEYGREIGRTDYNAGNESQDIPDTHHHTKEYNAQFPDGHSTGDHLPNEYPQ
jgi:hypothetical protein